MKSTDKVSFTNNWDFSLNLKTKVGKDKQALIKFYYNIHIYWYDILLLLGSEKEQQYATLIASSWSSFFFIAIIGMAVNEWRWKRDPYPSSRASQR